MKRLFLVMLICTGIAVSASAEDAWVFVWARDRIMSTYPATVYVDGVSFGQTNAAFSVQLGTHVFTLGGTSVSYSPSSVTAMIAGSPTNPTTVTFTFDPGAPPPPDPPPDDIQDTCNPQCSPIIINFENGGYRLTGANAPVSFDMLGNGHPILMGWTAAGADEAFLWLDRNHNGIVTGGLELFGNFTPLRSGYLAKNGFEALAEFDANHDGVIDEHDPIWPQLLLWRDLNHDGVCEPGETSPLSTSGVTEIDLHDHWTGKHDSWGNAFRYDSLISISDRSSHVVRKHPVYDIFFVTLSQ